jgi:hypothetical protein
MNAVWICARNLAAAQGVFDVGELAGALARSGRSLPNDLAGALRGLVAAGRLRTLGAGVYAVTRRRRIAMPGHGWVSSLSPLTAAQCMVGRA